MPRQPMTDEEFAAFRLRILANAASIVGTGGLAALSMRALAKSLGVTQGLIYRYFSSKQDLLWAFWQDALVDLRSKFAQIDEKAGTPIEAIAGMLRCFATFGLADQARFRMLFLDYDPSGLDILARDALALQPYLILLKNVERAIAAGTVKPGNAEMITQVLWASVHGVVTLVTTIDKVDFGNVGELVDMAIATALRGVSA